MLQQIKKSKKGFTLVELLVVIAIVAILAVVVLVAINPLDTLRKTRNSRRLSDLGEVKKAVDLAIAEGNGSIAPFGTTSFNSCANPTNWVQFADTSISLTKYLPALPRDPNNGAMPLCYVFKPNVGGTPSNPTAAAGTLYKLTTRLENTADSCNIMNNDGGVENDPPSCASPTLARFETGSDLSIP